MGAKRIDLMHFKPVMCMSELRSDCLTMLERWRALWGLLLAAALLSSCVTREIDLRDQDGDGLNLLEDCNDLDAEVTAPTWYLDLDGDGYGDSGSSWLACTVPPGYVTSPDDCDDGDPLRSPGATEGAGDGIDQDCDGSES